MHWWQDSKTASEQEAHWHNVYFLSFFPSVSLNFGFLCFISSSLQDWNVEEVPPCTSHWVYCSLNLRMLEIIWPVKCRSVGNPWEGWHTGIPSICLSSVPVCGKCHLLPTMPGHSLPIFCPCPCPIAAIDSWAVLMWPRLYSQHITLPLPINWLD